MMFGRKSVLCGMLALVGGVVSVRADSGADLTSVPGSAATVVVTIYIDSIFGADSDSSTDTVATTGTATAVLTPTDPPWSGATFDSFVLAFDTMQLDFDLYCVPIFGCQDLDATISNLVFTAVEPFSAAVAPAGEVSFSQVNFHVTGTAEITGLGGMINETIILDNTAPGDFAGRITGSAGIATFDSLVIDPVTQDVPPEELPDGVYAVTVTMVADLSNTVYQGPYTEIEIPCIWDLDGNGVINPVDSGLVMSNFGCPVGTGDAQCDASDIDGNGVVNPVDSGLVMSMFGACPE